MSYGFEVTSGSAAKFLTAGKYCDRDIVVHGTGSDPAELQTRYNEGVNEGLTQGKTACAAKHFVHTFVGNGASSVSFHVPFEPDLVSLVGFDPRINNTATGALTSLAALNYDIRAIGLLVGIGLRTDEGGTIRSTMITHTSAPFFYSRAEDGTVTLQDIKNSPSPLFSSGHSYTVVSVQYTEKTDAQRITDFIDGLGDSGTVALQQSKVEAAFADDEWAALIAARPGWTFTWI